MIDALPLLLGPEGYQISRSVRLRSSASAYLNRTLTTPTNNLKWTWSGWVKRGTLSVSNVFFGAGDGSSNNFGSLQFTTGNTIQFAQINGGAYNVQMVTSAVFRDPSAWYHLVIIYDSANATSTDRVQIYVNGVRQSVTYSTGPFAQNTASKINSAIAHYTGKLDYAGVYFDGYITENNFIDGQALDPSYFGETNTVTGVWQPKKYAGTYGTNGFYLNFSDNSAATAAAIGKDYSGNGNNWTPNNISVTAGVTYDSMLDVPTQWADGGNGRGNYAVLNPLIPIPRGTISAANLQYASGSTSSHGSVAATITMPTTGKWYWEVTACNNSGGSGNNEAIGIANIQNNPQLPAALSEVGSRSGDYAYRSNGVRVSGGSSVSYGATYTNGDVIGVAWDSDNGTLTFYKNGVSQGTAYSSITQVEGRFAPASSNAETAGSDVYNFGQRPFAYTPPSGFKALNTLNLPTPTILKGNQYFDATTYTGTGASLNVVNSGGMQPDFVWTKPRSTAVGHTLFDSVRGVTKYLQSNTTGAEGTAATSLTAFNSDGFTVNSDTSTGANGVTYVGWQWKEGATQGFDIVTGTSTGTTGTLTLAHSLGVAPAMVIAKNRNVADDWYTWHTSLGASSAGNAIRLNTTAAKFTSSGIWGTGFTSSNLLFGQTNWFTASGQGIVAYAFSEVAGFSKFGSYTGNGSTDGPFVFCGFRPRFVMMKRTDTTGSWIMWDTSRNTYNQAQNYLLANASDAEANNGGGAGSWNTDVLSNGFKVRSDSSAAQINASGGTYIFAAFAENPFKHSLAR